MTTETTTQTTCTWTVEERSGSRHAAPGVSWFAPINAHECGKAASEYSLCKRHLAMVSKRMNWVQQPTHGVSDTELHQARTARSLARKVGLLPTETT